MGNVTGNQVSRKDDLLSPDRIMAALITAAYLAASIIGLVKGEYKAFWLFFAIAVCSFFLLDLHTLVCRLWKSLKGKKRP